MKMNDLDTASAARAWQAFQGSLGVAAIRTPKQHERMVALMNQILDVVGENERHPLAGLLDPVGVLVAAGGAPKVMKEYDPPVFPLRWLRYGGLLFMSGVTDMTHATLDEQFPEIIQRITGTLKDGGASWQEVKKASFLLHHEESLALLRERFSAAISVPIPDTDYSFVGTRQGKRLEVEITAKIGGG